MAFKEVKHPLIMDKLTRMRKMETSSKDFKENLNEIASLMVYEIARDIPLKTIEIKTPIMTTKGYTIEVPVVVVPILRAGLGMTEGICDLIPTARVAHVGMYRDETTLKPKQYYAKHPDKISESYLIVVDPMLATGGSAIAAIDVVKQ